MSQGCREGVLEELLDECSLQESIITFHSFLNYSEAFSFFTMAIPWCDRGQYAGGQHLPALHTDVEPGPDPGQPDKAEEDRYSYSILSIVSCRGSYFKLDMDTCQDVPYCFKSPYHKCHFLKLHFLASPGFRQKIRFYVRASSILSLKTDFARVGGLKRKHKNII